MKNSAIKIEVFSAGCPVCQQTIDVVNRIGSPSPEVTVLDMNDVSVARRAADLGIQHSGDTLFLSPGVQFILLKNLAAEFSVQAPIYEKYKTVRLATDFTVST